MPKLDPSKDPSTRSSAYKAMLPKWQKIQALLDGEDAMKAAKTRYLPQHPKETDDTYSSRLHGATLVNRTRQVLDSWVGRPFSDPIKLSDDMPEEMVKWLEDIDLQGNNQDVFGRDWFKIGLAKCFCHVLVDMPAAEPLEPGRIRTRADDKRENVRPYCVIIPPENIIDIKGRVENGVFVKTHVRILEDVVEENGFAEKVVHRIKVWSLGQSEEEVRAVFVSTYELKQKGKQEPQWEQVGPARMLDIDFIPIVTFYADRSGVMEGKPPLEDLANINIRHWVSQSEQNSILSVARFPMLGASGVTDEEANTQLGPRTLLWSEKEKGKFYYVEHTGKAIEAGDKDLQNLERQMAEYGADYLRKRPDGETATARALDSAEATSPLQDAVLRFQDAFNLMLEYMARWMDDRNMVPGTVEISRDFGPEELRREDIETIREMRKSRDLSHSRYVIELKRRGILADDFDDEENQKELEEESMQGMNKPDLDLDPTQGEGDDDDDSGKGDGDGDEE